MKNTQIAIFIAGITTILFLTHLVVYEGVLAVFNIDSSWAVIVMRILLILSPITFVTLTALSARYNTWLNRNLYKYNAIWLGFLFYFFWATVIYGIVVGLFAVLPQDLSLHVFGASLYAAGALVAIYGLVHAEKIVPVRVSITLPNLPEAWRGKKVLFVSDWHLGQIHAKSFARKVVDAINSLAPEVVFIGGDLYDGVAVDKDDVIGPLKQIRAPRGTYFITGNHDGFTYEDMVKDVSAIEKTGIKVLRNEIVDLDGLQLIGIDYMSTAARENYKKVLAGLAIDRNKPSIMLKHVPSDVDLSAEAGVSLQISGHTHRSQVQPLSFLPRLVYKGFDYGHKVVGNFQEFTSSGVGTWGPPLRVGTNSEIVLIELN